MMEYLKKIVKETRTFFMHPLLMMYLWKSGSKNIVIGSRISIRRKRFLQMNNNISIGNDARFLFVNEYYGKTYNPKIEIGSNVA